MQDTPKSTSPSLMDHEFTFRDLADSAESPKPSSQMDKAERDSRKNSVVLKVRIKTLKSVELMHHSGVSSETKTVMRPQEHSLKKTLSRLDSKHAATKVRQTSKVLIRSTIQTSKFSIEAPKNVNRRGSFNIFEDNYDEWVSRRGSTANKTVAAVSEFKISTKSISTRTGSQGSSKMIESGSGVDSKSPANRSASRSHNVAVPGQWERITRDVATPVRFPMSRQSSLPRAALLADSLSSAGITQGTPFLKFSPSKSDKASKPGVDIRLLHVKRNCNLRTDVPQK